MSLPDGVTTCLLTYGPITDTFGNLAESITVEVVADRDIVHAASGRTMFDNPVSVSADGGGVAQIPMPHTDQSGFRDKQQNSLTGWYYIVRLTARFAGGGIKTDTKTFQPLVGQTTVDADLLPSNGMVTPGVTAPTATVTSVNNQTGAVTLPEVSVNEDGQLLVDGEPIETGSNLEGTVPVNARIDIVTAGKAPIVSKDIDLPAVMTVSGMPGVADYAATGVVSLAGNQTATLAKKPYKWKPDTKASILGMAPFNHWRLLANFEDRSFLNTAMAFAIGQSMDGLDWTPHSQFGQLHVNGEYVGLYQFTETAKLGAGRIDYAKVSGTTGLASTGAYLAEINNQGQDPDAPSFTTTQDVRVLLDDPSGTVPQHLAHLQARVQAFEDALFGSTFTDPTTGYRAHIDVDSFIDWYLVEELARNIEGAFSSSCKFVLTRDTTGAPGRLFMGPLWDFDHSFGDTIMGVEYPAEGYHVRTGAVWFTRLFEDPWFAAQIATRWQTLATRLTTTGPLKIGTLVDSLTARVAAAAIEDQEKWGLTAEWSSTAATKKAWITARVQWLTDQLVPATVVPGQVTGLTAGTPTVSTVPLTWLRGTTGGGPTGYIVQYSLDEITWTTFDTTVPRAATITGLSPATTYKVRIIATNAIGNGTPSATLTVSTADPAFAPTDITGLSAWWDGSDAASITQSSGVVSQWNDKSGNGNHLTQATAGARPTLVGDLVHFDGSDYLVSNLDATVATRTIAIVYKRAGTGQYETLTGTTLTGGLQFRISPIPQGEALVGNTALLSDTFGADNLTPTADPMVIVLTMDGTQTHAIHNDGAFVAGSTSKPLAFTGPSRHLTLGASADPDANFTHFLTGDIAEVVIVERDLTGDADLAALYGYFSDKHGTPTP